MCTILRMENVGENKDVLLFYGINDMYEVAVLRQKITYLVGSGKKLENANTLVETCDVLDCGSTYYYSHTQDTGELVFKSAIFKE